VIVPPEYAGSSPEASAILKSSQKLVLRTEIASSDMATQFLDSLKHDHTLIREMLGSGYTSLIVLPQYISGWRNGRLTHVRSQNEEIPFGAPRFRGKDDYSPCGQ
jgi:hypothetical protein